MYTVTYKSKTKNATSRKLFIVVTVSDGVEPFDKVFEFPLYTTQAQIERIIKEYIDELDAGDALYDQVPEQGTVLDLAAVGSDVSPEKLAFVEFLKDVARRERAQKFIDWGVVSANANRVTALNNKIQTTLQTYPDFLDQL